MPHTRRVADYEPVAPPSRRRDSAAGDGADFATPGGWPATRADNFGAGGGGGDHEESVESARRKEVDEGARLDESVGDARRAGRAREILRRGHALSFAGLFLFTAVLYFRPYEYLPVPATVAFWLAALTLAAYFPTQLSLEGNLTARPREVNLVLLFALLAVVSIPLAASRGRAWEAFNETFAKAALMFVVIVNVVRTRRRLWALLLLSLAVSCALAVGALRDFRAGNFTVEGYRVAGSIGGMFGNPNDMALHLVTMVPLALALALGARNLAARSLYAACALLFAAAIVVTYSRGGFLGLAAVVLALAWKLGRRHRFAVMAVALVALALLLAFAPGNYLDRVASIFGAGADSGSASARRALFWRSVYVAVANPVFGVGIGNFPAVSIREQVSHNAYTQVAAEMGFAAAVVYVLFMIAPLRSLARIERARFAAGRRDRAYHLSVGLQAALVGYMVSSFFASVAYQFYVYYLVGYAVALRRITAAEEARAADATLGANEGAGERTGGGTNGRAGEGRDGLTVGAEDGGDEAARLPHGGATGARAWR